MENTNRDTLQHYGVLGMKWGVIRNRRKLERASKRVEKLKAKKKEQDKLLRSKNKLKKMLEEEQTLKGKLDKGKAEIKPKSKPDTDAPDKADAPKLTKEKRHKRVGQMTDDELRARINRLNMEKQYRDLISGEEGKQKTQQGEGYVKSILKDSGKNIGSQLADYMMGSGVNWIAKKLGTAERPVNPTKRQKQK